jgi:hypothetical protein
MTRRIEARRCSLVPIYVWILAITVAGCSAGTSPTAIGSPSSSPSSSCPNGDGGECLGPLEAGTHSTVEFRPQITYRVPSGWANYEDLPGSFLLVPPGGNLPGVDANTSDFIGIYASIAPDAQDCSGRPAPGVGLSVSDITSWMIRQPGLNTTQPQQVVIGGLHGEVLDVRMTNGWTKACHYPSATQPVVPLIVGIGISDLDHGIEPGVATRLYLLDSAGGALAIEVVDVSGGSHLDAYSEVVNAVRFAT